MREKQRTVRLPQYANGCDARFRAYLEPYGGEDCHPSNVRYLTRPIELR